MGYYTGVYTNKCPRCSEGDVLTVFQSASPMFYSEECNNCAANDFNEAEHQTLGDKMGTYRNSEGVMERFNYEQWKGRQVDPDETDPAYD